LTPGEQVTEMFKNKSFTIHQTQLPFYLETATRFSFLRLYWTINTIF